MPVRRTEPLSADRRTLRARKARAVRYGLDTTDVDRDLAAAKLEDFVGRVLAVAPPLTEAQRYRIAAILFSTSDGGA